MEKHQIIESLDYTFGVFDNYSDAFDFQYKSILYKMPVWEKNDMWEDYYLPYCDVLKEVWDMERDIYLEMIRE